MYNIISYIHKQSVCENSCGLYNDTDDGLKTPGLLFLYAERTVFT